MLEAALRTIPDRRGRGIDLFPPRLLKEASVDAKKAFVQLLASIEEEAALPMQQLMNVIALLPKSGGGHRPIALMGICCVILLRIRRPYVQAWDRAYHGPWDKTVGGSAEAAGWLDELESELALHQGFQVAGLLLDIRKFYDSVNLADLVDAAIELNYPLRLLALALDSYLGV
eukprot:9482925-Pyramimonas_sp.AAC.1